MMNLDISRGHQKPNSSYWDDFYRREEELPPPSQFAVFVASELSSVDLVLDIGCGIGRDSFFFLQQKKIIIGVDISTVAIECCRKRAACAGDTDGEFICGSIDDRSVQQMLIDRCKRAGCPLIYARFFLHATDEAGEKAFFQLAKGTITDRGYVAVEFRTIRDISLQKVTPAHYRRFIDPLGFAARAQNSGFTVTYFVEGFGMAKYRADDAYVARFLLTRNGA